MLSYSRPVERCRPLLGTFVRIRVTGLPPEGAQEAIDAAFAEIAEIHRLMSFHEPESDVSRINREAHREAVEVDARTYAVLARASAISLESGGAFDITVAPRLVRSGALPHPWAPEPDPEANWRDVQLSCRRVRFRRPAWMDLGGIAKGYAVDRAITVLQAFSPVETCVNAGGDLRITGCGRVRLGHEEAAFVDLERGSIASSRATDGVHIGAPGRHFVSVAAPECIDADALTKVVLARGAASADLLARRGARAWMHDGAGWRHIGGP
jgi:FAD:protein FMN transferase